MTIDDESDNAPTINFTTTSGGTGVTESASAASPIDIDSKISLMEYLVKIYGFLMIQRAVQEMQQQTKIIPL